MNILHYNKALRKVWRNIFTAFWVGFYFLNDVVTGSCGVEGWGGGEKVRSEITWDLWDFQTGFWPLHETLILKVPMSDFSDEVYDVKNPLWPFSETKPWNASVETTLGHEIGPRDYNWTPNSTTLWLLVGKKIGLSNYTWDQAKTMKLHKGPNSTA